MWKKYFEKVEGIIETATRTKLSFVPTDRLRLTTMYMCSSPYNKKTANFFEKVCGSGLYGKILTFIVPSKFSALSEIFVPVRYYMFVNRTAGVYIIQSSITKN